MPRRSYYCLLVFGSVDGGANPSPDWPGLTSLYWYLDTAMLPEGGNTVPKLQ